MPVLCAPFVTWTISVPSHDLTSREWHQREPHVLFLTHGVPRQKQVLFAGQIGFQPRLHYFLRS